MKMKNLLGIFVLFAGSLFASTAFATNWPLNPGGNLTATIEQAADGDTITLAPGVYTPSAVGTVYPGGTQFAVVKRVRIVGGGLTPSEVTLSAPSTNSLAVVFLSYTYAFDYSSGSPIPLIGNPSGATLENLTIESGAGGVDISDVSSRLHDISLKNVVIHALTNNALSFGVVLDKVDRIVLENVEVTSSSTAFYIRDSSETLLMNSTVISTSADNSNALAVLGGERNIIVNNALGTPVATPGVRVNGAAVAFYNTQRNRFEFNTVQGHRDDGVDFHNTNLSGVPTQQTLDNYAGKNSVISNGWAAGRLGGTGMWVNCSANNSWLYGNDVQGGPEAGMTIWLSNSNMLLGNSTHNNKDAGLFLSGAADTTPFCPVTAYQVKPDRNYLYSNSAYFNQTDSIVVRTSDHTDVVMNHISPTNGFGGTMQSCTASTCQSAFSVETNVSGARILRNTSDTTNRGLWVFDGTVTGLEFFGNRMIGSTLNRLVQPSTYPNLDWGSHLGGNYWSQWPVVGNPSSTTPFTQISYDTANDLNGPVADRYPFQSETFGAAQLTVSEPLSGQYALGSARTVRWYAPGCTYVDISLDGGAALNKLDGTTPLPTNLPNTGYTVVRIPAGTSLGNHHMVVSCKNSSGTATGLQTSSPSFTVKSADLTLLSPGRDDVFIAGDPIWVSWKRASTLPTGTVTVELSTDGGTSFSALVTSYPLLVSAATADFARVTLPAVPSTAYAVLRISSGAAGDTTDGVFAIRGASGAGFKNIPDGRSFNMGRMERLEWASPQGSRLVSISYSANGTPGSVVTDLPDRGYLDWIVPDIPSSSLVLTITYKTSAGTTISPTLTSGTTSTVYTSVVGMFALSVNKLGSGSVTAPGISCGTACSQSYLSGTALTLSATADPAWTFSNWSGACSGTASTCNLTMDAAKSVVATFTANFTGTLITRYRLYSDGTKEHLYTTDFNEYSVLPVCCGWLAEGAIYKLFQGAGSLSGVAAVPYYRLYNPLSHQHHWTTDLNEYTVLATLGWTQEGVDGYILPTAATGAVPLYRLYLNAYGGLHLWTTDGNERTVLSTTAGWVDEGVAGFVVPLP